MNRIDYVITLIAVSTVAIALIAVSTLMLVPQTAQAQSGYVATPSTSAADSQRVRASVRRNQQRSISAEATLVTPTTQRARLEARNRPSAKTTNTASGRATPSERVASSRSNRNRNGSVNDDS